MTTLTAPAWLTVRGATENLLVGYEGFATQGRHTFSAVVAANVALSQAVGRVSLEVVSLGGAAVEDAATAAALVDAKPLEDVVALRYEFTKNCVERFIAGGARLSDLGLTAAGEVFEPLGAQAIEALKKPLAA